MAGAINAVAEGAAGLYTNPASAAIRPETRIDKFAWNVYVNSYIPADGQDSNNNGQTVTSVHRSLLGAAGLLFQYGAWGVSLDGGYTAHEIAAQAGGGLGVRSLIAHLTLARTFLDQALSAGVGIRAGGLNVYTLGSSQLMGTQQLFTRAGGSAEARRGLDAQGSIVSAGRQRRSAHLHGGHSVQLRSHRLRRLHAARQRHRALGRHRQRGVPVRVDALEPPRRRRLPRRALADHRAGLVAGRRRRRWLRHGGLRRQAAAGLGARRQPHAAAGGGIRDHPGLAAAARRHLPGGLAVPRDQRALARDGRVRGADLLVSAAGPPAAGVHLRRGGRRRPAIRTRGFQLGSGTDRERCACWPGED